MIYTYCTSGKEITNNRHCNSRILPKPKADMRQYGDDNPSFLVSTVLPLHAQSFPQANNGLKIGILHCSFSLNMTHNLIPARYSCTYGIHPLWNNIIFDNLNPQMNVYIIYRHISYANYVSFTLKSFFSQRIQIFILLQWRRSLWRVFLLGMYVYCLLLS